MGGLDEGAVDVHAQAGVALDGGYEALCGGDFEINRPAAGVVFAHLLHALEGLQAEGIWPPWEAVEQLFTVATHRDLVVFITDLHEQKDEIRTVLAKVNALKNEVLLFHLLGRRELDFSYEGVLEFEELETGRVMQVDADRIRRDYREAVDGHLREVRQELQDLSVAYALFTLDQPLDGVLRTFLTRRMRREN